MCDKVCNLKKPQFGAKMQKTTTRSGKYHPIGFLEPLDQAVSPIANRAVPLLSQLSKSAVLVGEYVVSHKQF